MVQDGQPRERDCHAVRGMVCLGPVLTAGVVYSFVLPTRPDHVYGVVAVFRGSRGALRSRGQESTDAKAVSESSRGAGEDWADEMIIKCEEGSHGHY